MTVRAKFVKHSICPCGFPILTEEIPLGTMYVVDPLARTVLSIMCGGCGRVIANIPSVYVEARGQSKAGYLPMEIFEMEDGGRHADS